MSQANALEEYMLELVNSERAKVGVAPLTFNNKLNSAAENHSSWMLDEDVFNHKGANGSNMVDRTKDAGYALSGPALIGENIGWQSKRGEEGEEDSLSDDVEGIHSNLMKSDAHKAAILNPEFKEIGIGIEEGEFFNKGTNWDAVMVTQNFGATGPEVGMPTQPNREENPDTPDDVTAADDTPRPAIVEPPADEDNGEEPKDDEIAEPPIDNANDDMNAEPPEDADETPNYADYDWENFDWRDWVNLDSLKNLPSGSGNNNGNGNTGTGINGRGNGFGNDNTGVNGSGNGNGNSDWWNARQEWMENLFGKKMDFDQNDETSTQLWKSKDYVPTFEMPSTFDDCFIM